MANQRPEVIPDVRTMPTTGWFYQTSGSARRRVTKNTGSATAGIFDVTGVPGHTHNASAVVSVDADYTRYRANAITVLAGVWSYAALQLIVHMLTDSAEPDNANERYDRVRLRNALAQADWIDVSAVAQSAAHLAEADAALAWMADLEYRSCLKKEPMGLRYKPQAPRAVALRVVARIVTELDGQEPRGSAVARLFEALCAGEPASIGNLVVRPNAGGWSFAKAPRRAVKS